MRTFALAIAAAVLAGGPAAAEEPFFTQPIDFDLAAPFPGPNGAPATPAADLGLSAEEEGEIRAGNYTAALLWHGSGDWVNAVTAGATARLGELGIELVATADA